MASGRCAMLVRFPPPTHPLLTRVPVFGLCCVDLSDPPPPAHTHTLPLRTPATPAPFVCACPVNSLSPFASSSSSSQGVRSGSLYDLMLRTPPSVLAAWFEKCVGRARRGQPRSPTLPPLLPHPTPTAPHPASTVRAFPETPMPLCMCCGLHYHAMPCHCGCCRDPHLALPLCVFVCVCCAGVTCARVCLCVQVDARHGPGGVAVAGHPVCPGPRRGPTRRRVLLCLGGRG